MNDGLHAAIADAISGAWSYLSGDEYDASNIIDAAESAVRAWLLLPPSHDELEIAADLIAEWRQVELQHGPVHKTSIDNFIAHRVLEGARAVLVAGTR